MLRQADLALLLLLTLAGCSSSPPAQGIGYVQHDRKDLTRDFEADVEEAWAASLEALRLLGYPDPERKSLGVTQGQILTDDARVRVERLPEVGTRVFVRVGTFSTRDNQRKALLILEETARILDEEEELREWSRKVQALSESG